MSCPVCGGSLVGRQKTCSPKCRKTLSRRVHAVEQLATGNAEPARKIVHEMTDKAARDLALELAAEATAMKYGYGKTCKRGHTYFGSHCLQKGCQ